MVIRSTAIGGLALGILFLTGAALGFPGSQGKEASPGGDAQPPAEAQPAAQISPDAPVVVVNGELITKGEFDRAMRAYLRNFQSMGGQHGGVNQPNQQMKSDVLDQLVDRELLYQASATHQAEGADGLVDQEWERVQGQFPSPEQFKAAYESEGLTEESLKELLRRQVLVRQYVEVELAKGVSVSEEEVAGFYTQNEAKFEQPEQVRCSHILIRADAQASAEDKEAAKKKAEEVRVRCVAGEDFATLAKELSEDPGSAARGGDLGFFTRERMVTPFAEAAFTLELDEISPVVETPFGYHVIKLHERKEASKQAFDDVKPQIEAYLKSLALDGVVRNKVAELRKEAKVDVVAPHL